jgi:ankyrin repeat protein
MTPDDPELVHLLDAIRDGRLADVAVALERRPTLVNACRGDGEMPLHAAAYHNDARMGALLVSRGADPNATYGASGHTPLSWAVTCHALDFANAMVRLGVDADLFCAAGMGSDQRVAACFDSNGALLPNAARTGSTRFASDGSRLACPPVGPVEQVSDALYIACRNAHRSVVRFLLAKSPDLAFKAYMGGTALHWAHFSGSPEVIELLMQAGADDSLRDDRFGVTPRAFGICTPANWGFGDLVRRHLDRDPSLAQVLDVTSPLHEAARGGHLDIVQMLLAAGADPARRDRHDRTARDLAVAGGHDVVVGALT